LAQGGDSEHAFIEDRRPAQHSSGVYDSDDASECLSIDVDEEISEDFKEEEEEEQASLPGISGADNEDGEGKEEDKEDSVKRRKAEGRCMHENMAP
jgi:hypothetical protein